MAEYRLFPEGETPRVSTAAFHAHRERAPHLEQAVHQPRLYKAAEYVRRAVIQHIRDCPGSRNCVPHPVSDLGCGDGGLLSLLDDPGRVYAWGYDFQPSNRAGWDQRGVHAESLDVFGADQGDAILGLTTVTTEVLEHLADPHAAVRWIGTHSRYLVASSPWNETLESHDECHAWAWDQPGYRALIEQGGFTILRHETVGQFQIILAEQKEAAPCVSS
ncbi:methyltransferase domain-containing protein [Streptomyces sp. NPDC002088]|uniref:methyltransferase domain-containing protein n=1 Tax=Streptomyces sp. NPDC002088 TaxID=3154665 RepID=UPI00332C4D65